MGALEAGRVLEAGALEAGRQAVVLPHSFCHGLGEGQ